MENDTENDVLIKLLKELTFFIGNNFESTYITRIHIKTTVGSVSQEIILDLQSD